MSAQLPFAKGQATLNDFVILSDADGEHDPSAAEVRFLCDRRAGVGGDGILRVVRGRHVAEWDGDPDLWFMDYRNADGSIAEMCGNGVRAFLLYLKHAGLVAPGVETLDIGTRAGLRTGTYLPDGRVKVWMGRPVVDAQAVTVSVQGASWQATPVDVGNPHAVAILGPGDDLSGLDLVHQPTWSPAGRFPQDVNVEFVTVDAPGEVTMRVYERGVGETKSCGTGTVAVAAAVARHEGSDGGSYTVHVPGGDVTVDLVGEDAYLTGPAQIVFAGTIDTPDGDQLG